MRLPALLVPVDLARRHRFAHYLDEYDFRRVHNGRLTRGAASEQTSSTYGATSLKPTR